MTLHSHKSKPKYQRRDAPAGSVIVKRKFDVICAESKKNAIQSKYSQNTDKPVKKSGLIWCFRNRSIFSSAYVSCYKNYPAQKEQMPSTKQNPEETIIQKGCHWCHFRKFNGTPPVANTYPLSACPIKKRHKVTDKQVIQPFHCTLLLLRKGCKIKNNHSSSTDTQRPNQQTKYCKGAVTEALNRFRFNQGFLCGVFRVLDRSHLRGYAFFLCEQPFLADFLLPLLFFQFLLSVYVQTHAGGERFQLLY